MADAAAQVAVDVCPLCGGEWGEWSCVFLAAPDWDESGKYHDSRQEEYTRSCRSCGAVQRKAAM